MAQAAAKATARIIDTACGNSAAFALDLPAKASAELSNKRGVHGRVPSYAAEVAKKTQKLLGYPRYGLDLSIESSIPPGLGETEAVSSATALAVCGALARKHGSVCELKIDKYVHHQFYLVDGKLIDRMKLISLCPGDFDRLFSSFFGGFSVCENRKKKVLRRGEMETMHWVSASPKKTRKKDEKALLAYRHERDLIFDECVKGNLYGAMRLSTLLYRDEMAAKMLSAGALAATTSFPAAVALTRDQKKVKDILKAAKGALALDGLVGNQESRVLTSPKRIVKTKEFLEIKGDEEYYLL